MTGPLDHSESTFLARGVESLRDQFISRGFIYQPGTAASSSGGPFATAHFRKGDLEVGLVVRHNSRLGCPNYSLGNGFAGHNDLVRALGYEGREDLVEGERLEFVSRSGRDAFAALRSDLESLILPVFDRSETEFRSALAVAVRDAHARLGF